MDAKKIAVIIIMISLLAVAVGFIVSDSFVNREPDGYYNYEITYSESYTSRHGLEIFAEEGHSFAIANIIIQNNNFSEGISTQVAVLVWKLTLDRVTYNLDVINTPLHPDYWSVTLEKGKVWMYTVVFDIPTQSIGKLDENITYMYNTIHNQPFLKYNGDLRLPDAFEHTTENIAPE